MTTYTVSTQAQGIYPDGLQESFAIVNNGPWTVLIDDQSSIGNGSFELPPLSAITWDANRPLWIAARPAPNVNPSTVDVGYVNATVLITGNTDVVNADRAQATVKLCDVNIAQFPGAPYIPRVFETEAFNTLTVDFESLKESAVAYTNTAPPSSNFCLTTIYWFSRDGVCSHVDHYQHPLQDSGASSAQLQKLVTAVKDSYAILYTRDQADTVDWSLAYNIYGQLRELPEAFAYWVAPAATTGPNITNIWPANLAADQTADTFSVLEWWNASTPPDLWVSPIKPKLHVSLRVLNTTVAGSLILETATDSLIVASAAIPVSAAATVTITTEYLPVGTPLRLRSTAATGIGRLLTIWQD